MVFAVAVVVPSISGAQEDDEPSGWGNTAELSLVVTEGNAETQTFGFKNTLRRTWDSARLRVRFDGVRSKTADERFLLVNPGIRFPVGGRPVTSDTRVVTPSVEPDVEQYFIEGRFDKNITERFFWNTGAGWDRNNDAGILNRYVLFGGVGNVWFNDDDLSFSTTYGLSYTDREEKDPDPNKNDVFGGLRFNSDYAQRLGSVTLFDSDVIVNLSLAEASDYSINMTNAVGIEITEALALRVSLQFLYENEPALEDVSLLALVKLIEPVSTQEQQGSLFETVSVGGIRLDLGDGKIRKNGLDTILRTALVISF